MNQISLTRRSPLCQRLALLAGAVASTLSLQAHPGHCLLEHGPLHTITSPVHLALLALLGAALFAGARLVQQRIPRRALQSVGTVVFVLCAVLLGLRG